MFVEQTVREGLGAIQRTSLIILTPYDSVSVFMEDSLYFAKINELIVL